MQGKTRLALCRVIPAIQDSIGDTVAYGTLGRKSMRIGVAALELIASKLLHYRELICSFARR
jgi:hypothetical protein